MEANELEKLVPDDKLPAFVLGGVATVKMQHNTTAKL
jgi:hypothetical protein